MPEESNNAFPFGVFVPFDGFIDGAVVVGLPVEPRVVRRVVLHIETSDHGNFVGFAGEIVVIEGGLTRQHIFVVILGELLVESFGFR